ncbi:MAG: glycosyltransferase family 2 protein [Gemmatimonadaceae bacterium]
MLYICIPSFDEAPTVGVLLWKIRKVFQEYSREYEILVYNDASTDATAETLVSYTKALPLTVIGGKERVGYAGALTELYRTAVLRTRYARRDAVITLQADFTDQPEFIPELVKRFEGGADIVVAQSEAKTAAPKPVRQFRTYAPWALKFSVKTPGVTDPVGCFRLHRVSVLRDALQAAGETPMLSANGLAANVELLLATTPHARRVETITLPSRYDLRPRDSRVKPLSDAYNLFRFGRAAGRRMSAERPPAPTSATS